LLSARLATHEQTAILSPRGPSGLRQRKDQRRTPCHQHQMLLSNEKLALQQSTFRASSSESPTIARDRAIAWRDSRWHLRAISSQLWAAFLRLPQDRPCV